MTNEFVPIEPPFDSIAYYGILSIAVIVAIAWVYLFSMGRPRRAVGLGVMTLTVMAISATAAWSGVLSSFDRFPPPMAVMIVSVFVMALGFGFSTFGREGTRLPWAALIGLQAFRFPLEMVMHHAGKIGIMPAQLSYSGFNFDIVTGIAAAVIAGVLISGRHVPNGLLWVWNLWGMACLLMITFIAVTTSPMVRFFGDHPGDLNTWVLFFPYVWLPVVLVTVAIAGHVVVSRKLLEEGGVKEPVS